MYFDQDIRPIEENKLIQQINNTRRKDSDIVYEFKSKTNRPSVRWGEWEDVSKGIRSLHMYSPSHNFLAKIKEIIR